MTPQIPPLILSFAVREPVAESPSRNALGTLRTQPGMPGGRAGRKRSPPRRAEPRASGPRNPACASSYLGTLGPRPQVLGKAATEACPVTGADQTCLFPTLRGDEERCVGNGWGQVWVRELGVGWAWTTSAPYWGLFFSNFGPTWSGLGNFFLRVSAYNPPGISLELVLRP